MILNRIILEDWRQFDSVDIRFHPKLTVLSGVNGCGKTTILKLIHGHFENVATPVLDGQNLLYVSRQRDLIATDSVYDRNIGCIYFGDEAVPSELLLPVEKFHHIDYQIPPKYRERIIFFPAHRRPFSYINLTSPNLNPEHKSTIARKIQISMIRNARADNTYSNSIDIRQAIVAWILNGYGSSRVQFQEIYKKNFEEFEAILKQVFPPEIGFKRLTVVENYNLLVETESGNFFFDVFSGGLSSILELAWIIFGYLNTPTDEALVLIDEAEIHLHASMQRTLLPNFISAFPNVQFVVTTHSPLVANSVKDSWIYVLKHNSEKRILSELIDINDEAYSTAQILRDVFGVSFSMPLWVEKEFEALISRCTASGFNESTIPLIREELTKLGLASLIPKAIMKVVDEECGRPNDQNS